MKARPVPQFVAEIRAHATQSQALTAGAWSREEAWRRAEGALSASGPQFSERRDAIGEAFALEALTLPPTSARLQFEGGTAAEASRAISVTREPESSTPAPNFVPAHAGQKLEAVPDRGCTPALDVSEEEPTLSALGSLKPLGQIRNSFIVAVNEDGLWIIDQHVAHERVLFERVRKQRATMKVESQRLLMPIVLELSPAQQAVFDEISEELAHNGFEAEPFGRRSVAVKAAPAGIESAAVEHMLHELLDQFSSEEQSLNLEKIRTGIAASIACHAAIKVNMPLEQNKMEWLLAELAKTDHPMSCPHGRPVVLRYSVKDIQKAFKRI